MTELFTAKAGIALSSGIVLAVQGLPQNIDVVGAVERIGLGGIAVWLIWWMLNSFSKRLDRLTKAIDRLADKHD